MHTSIKRNTIDYLNILKNEIHSTVVATVNENGYPTTRVIDIMWVDEKGLYFITAKGKAFYNDLRDRNYVAISGIVNKSQEAHDALAKKSISVRGKVERLGDELLEEIFEENQYMKKIYPENESRVALEVFRLYEGEGEYFDLSTRPITRESFTIGKKILKCRGYFITDQCQGCGKCYKVCPQKCIIIGKPSVIQDQHCLHCGNCLEACLYSAVIKQ